MSRSRGLLIRVVPTLVIGLVLFTGSAASASASSRADAIARGFGGEAAGQSDFSVDGRWLAGGVMVITAGLALGLGLWQLRKWCRRRRSRPAGVEAAIARTLGLSRRERRVLRRAAAELGVTHGATFLICPSLLRQARSRLGPKEAPTLALLLDRLAA